MWGGGSEPGETPGGEQREREGRAELRGWSLGAPGLCRDGIGGDLGHAAPRHRARAVSQRGRSQPGIPGEGDVQRGRGRGDPHPELGRGTGRFWAPEQQNLLMSRG